MKWSTWSILEVIFKVWKTEKNGQTRKILKKRGKTTIPGVNIDNSAKKWPKSRFWWGVVTYLQDLAIPRNARSILRFLHGNHDRFSGISLVRIAFLLSSTEQNPPRILPYMDSHVLENGYAHRPRTSCQYIPVYTSHSHGSFVPELSYCDLTEISG